jgi:hypothetical protein
MARRCVSRVVGLGGAAILTTMAVACSGGGEGAGPMWSVVEDPALSRADPITVVVGAATANLPDGPVYLGGFEAAGDLAAGQPALWSSEDGVAWSAVEDDAFTVDDGWISAVAAEGDAVVAVGSFVEAGVYRPGIWTSASGDQWTAVAVDFDGGDVDLSSVSAGGDGRFVAAGGEVDGGERRVVVARGTIGGEWTVTPVSGSDDAFATSVAADGRRVLVSANALELEGRRPTGWLSTDGGATWREVARGTFGEAGAGGVSVAVWVGDAFLVFGTTTDNSALTAWFSPDGESWEELPATINGEPIELAPATAVWVGGGVVVVGADVANPTFPGAVVVTPDGEWQALGSTANPDSDHPSMGTGPVALLGDELVFVTPVPRTVELQVVGDSGSEVVEAGTPPFTASASYVDGNGFAVTADGVVIGGSTGPEGDATEYFYAPTLWSGEPGRLESGEVADALTVTALATADDGTIAATGNLHGAASEASEAGEGETDYNDVWIGTVSEDGSIARTGTVTGPGEQLIGSLAQHDGRWYLGGAVQPDSTGLVQHAAIWSSPDLATWTAEEGDFETDSVEHVCAGGTPLLAVGAIRDDDRVLHPAAWRRGEAASWSLVELPSELAEGVGALSGCVADAERTVAVGSIDAEPVVVTIAANGEVTRLPFEAERYQQLADIVQSDDGLVIVGTDTGNMIDRPTMWASRDGSEWRNSDGPTSAAGSQSSAIAAAFRGDDLLVLGAISSGVGLWSVEDVFAGL